MQTLTGTIFGERLRLMRERLELSQEELGALLDLSARKVRRHEQREHAPPASDVAEQLAAPRRHGRAQGRPRRQPLNARAPERCLNMNASRMGTCA